MIKNVKELQEYILKDLEEYTNPIFRRPLMMTSPGCSEERLEVLKRALPGIPDSYTKWVGAINLNGISVGYFQVSPASFNEGDMVDNLIEGNDGYLFHEYASEYHLYSVATISGYGVFVATANSDFPEGEIILIDEDIYSDQENSELWIFRLAKDFEQFLVVAGNLNQIQRNIIQDASRYDERKAEFLGRLHALGVDEVYHPAWLRVL